MRTIKQGVQPLQTGIRAQGSTCTPCPRPALSACHCLEWLALHRAWRRLLADPHACLPCQRQRQHTPELANSNDGLAISDVAALLGLVPAPQPCRVLVRPALRRRRRPGLAWWVGGCRWIGQGRPGTTTRREKYFTVRAGAAAACRLLTRGRMSACVQLSPFPGGSEFRNQKGCRGGSSSRASNAWLVTWSPFGPWSTLPLSRLEKLNPTTVDGS